MGLCPVCGFSGRFNPYRSRKNAVCPNCSSKERHRHQYLVLCEYLTRRRPGVVLHVAPERGVRNLLNAWASRYITFDLDPRRQVDIHASLEDIPLAANSIDVVFASHVLEHIENVDRAIAEIFRVLRPGGAAILEVPLSRGATVKIAPSSNVDAHHWQCGRRDWHQRYRAFQNVQRIAPGPGSAIFSAGGSPVFICEKRAVSRDEQFWNRRMAAPSLKAVGHQEHTEEQNEAEYKEAAEVFLRVLDEAFPGDRGALSVLDIGYGLGHYARLCHQAGFGRYTGIDFAGHPPKGLPPAYQFASVDAAQKFDLGQKFDLVLMIDMAYHAVADARFDQLLSNVAAHQEDAVIVTGLFRDERLARHVQHRSAGAFDRLGRTVLSVPWRDNEMRVLRR